MKYLVKYTVRFSRLKYEEEVILESSCDCDLARKIFRQMLEKKETIRIAALKDAPSKFNVQVVIYDMQPVNIN